MKKYMAWLVALLFYGSILPWAGAEYFKINASDIVAKSPWVDVRAYGAIANDNVDDDAALVAATTVALATGLPMLFPAGQFDFSNQWAISSDRDSYYKPLEIIGAGSDGDGMWTKTAPQGGTILNFKYSGGAKIIGNGRGKVKIRGVNFYNSGTDNQYFIYGESTIWDIQGNSFWGGSNRNGGVQLGGDNTATGYQGYGTIISNNFLQRIHVALDLRTWANGVVSNNNTLSTGCGGEAAIVFNPASGQAVVGVNISGWVIEMSNYSYGVKGSADTVGNYFAGNGFYDPGDVNKIAYNMNGGAYNTIVESKSSADDLVMVDSTGMKYNTVIRNNQDQASSLGNTRLNVYSVPGGIRFFGAYGHSIYSGDNTSTWSKSEYLSGNSSSPGWSVYFTSDNGAVTIYPFRVYAYPDGDFVNSTTEFYSAYTLRFRSASSSEIWGDYVYFRNAAGGVMGYAYDNNLYLPNAGTGIVMKNAADNVTKKVRLNDAGDGFIFE